LAGIPHSSIQGRKKYAGRPGFRGVSEQEGMRRLGGSIFAVVFGGGEAESRARRRVTPVPYRKGLAVVRRGDGGRERAILLF